jgi:hypothetical protein
MYITVVYGSLFLQHFCTSEDVHNCHQLLWMCLGHVTLTLQSDHPPHNMCALDKDQLEAIT